LKKDQQTNTDSTVHITEFLLSYEVKLQVIVSEIGPWETSSSFSFGFKYRLIYHWEVVGMVFSIRDLHERMSNGHQICICLPLRRTYILMSCNCCMGCSSFSS